MKKFTRLFILSVFVVGLMSSFSYMKTAHANSAFFKCIINDKPFQIDNLIATLRRITGGETQLSISNDRFVKFAFLNPKALDKIDLASAGRKVIIRYEDPNSLHVGEPVKGYVYISSINRANKTVSGEFEFDMELNHGGVKKIVKVKQGKFENLPIEIR
jgi:hypothetical protein